MTILIAQLEALAAAPREWRVTTLYESGAVKVYDTHTEAGANNFAIGERRKIGRNLIDRTTGETVRVAEVTMARI